jgi:hypothetical protein
MSFLSPLFLLAAAAVAVPLALHLFHRHESRRVVFPALRYLLRTEKEHARRIRLRQLLLLLVRCAIVVLLVLAGARLVFSGRGTAHPPTAVVVILDNSLSSGRVIDETRVLDRLKEGALVGLSEATPEDRIWVLRAGEPWDVAVPGSAGEARVRIRTTEVSAARGDLSSALRRARQLVADADMAAGEIHLVSDLQATGFDDEPVPGDNPVPVLAWAGVPAPDTPNRYLLQATIGGGLPPLANRRTEISAGLAGGAPEQGEVPVRLFVDGRVRGAAAVRPGAAAVLPVGPFPAGWVEGYIEADPDALRDDDRRWFAVPVRPPPVVAVTEGAGMFVASALAVLADAGRVSLGAAASADILILPAGVGLDTPGPSRRVVLAPTNPAMVPAVNRRLADAGVEWRFRDGDSGGEAGIAESGVPVDLSGVRVRNRYLLETSAGASGIVLARLSDGTPWIVAVEGSRAPVLLIGSALEEAASTLPLDAAMVPLLEWVVTGWGAGGARPPGQVGEAIPLPSAATEVERPDGTRLEVDGSLELRTPRDAGIYRVFRGDSLLDLVAVNPPVRESILDPLPADRLSSRVGPVRIVDNPDRWASETFTRRQGFESWWVLLGIALGLLILETWIAASGGSWSRSRSSPAIPTSS